MEQIIKPFGYIRVSGLGQVDKDGPIRQREAILAFCDRMGWPAPVFIEDAGVSGTLEGVARPGFQELIVRAVASGSNCVIVETMQRLARDLIVSELAVRELAKRGFMLYSVEMGPINLVTDAGEDPSRKFIRQIFAATAELDKSTLVLKLKIARERMRSKTGRCEGAKPYGKNKQEVQLVEMVYKLRESDLSWRAIARMFNQTGVRKRQGVKDWRADEIYKLWKLHEEQRAKTPTPFDLSDERLHVLRPESQDIA